MREPWDDPTHAAWRIYADYLMESGASAPALKRAVKFALGFRERPKLVLIAQSTADTTDSEGQYVHAGATCGILRGHRWNYPGLVHHRWVTPSWYVREMTRLCGPERALDFLDRTLGTPADFPDMLDPDRGGHYPLRSEIVYDFYRKASENVAVRCRKGVITVRRSRKGSAPWSQWRGE